MSKRLIKVTFLCSLLFCQFLLSQNPSIYSKFALIPKPDCWVIGPFPEGISENEIKDDVTELIQTDPAYPKPNNDSRIPMRLRILLVREFEDSCSPMKITWSLGVSWTKDGETLATYPNVGNMNLQKFSNHSGIGSAQIIRKKILHQVQQRFIPDWRSTINIHLMPRIRVLPSSFVDIENADGAIVRGGCLEISPPPIACNPPSAQYPPLAGLAGIQGQVIVDVVADENGYPYRALGVGGPPQLRYAAGNWVLGWKFDMSGKIIEKSKWYRFKVTIPFILEEASMPGPIIQRPGCIVGRKSQVVPNTVY